MSEIITVEIPTDGTIPPCEICGGITVDLDGNPKRCPMHDKCAPCGGTPDKWMPHFCPIHCCHEWFRDPRDPRGQGGWMCELRNEHDGEHMMNDVTFTEWGMLKTEVEVKICVDYKPNNQGGMSPIYEWRKQVVHDVRPGWQGEGGPRVNDYDFSRWRRA